MRGLPDERTGRYRAAMGADKRAWGPLRGQHRLDGGGVPRGLVGGAAALGGRLPVSRLPFARGWQVLRSCKPDAPKAPGLFFQWFWRFSHIFATEANL
ncbi:hypothetical protein G6F31_020828 [Rhizopus arrhizus]|nr:hypothetical protein G6F31_020828 [Rhizopus arrhizus]